MGDDIKLKRDQNNKLDKDDAERVQKELIKRLITEERHYQKEISFKNARGAKRDIFIFVTIAQRNSIDGKVVLGDPVGPGQYEKWANDDPYAYKVFDYVEGEIPAKMIPMKLPETGKFLMGVFKAVTNYLARMNVING